MKLTCGHSKKTPRQKAKHVQQTPKKNTPPPPKNTQQRYYKQLRTLKNSVPNPTNMKKPNSYQEKKTPTTYPYTHQISDPPPQCNRQKKISTKQSDLVFIKTPLKYIARLHPNPPRFQHLKFLMQSRMPLLQTHFPTKRKYNLQ